MTTSLTKKISELLRFGAVGGFCFVLGLILLFIFTDLLGWHYLLSMAMALLLVNIVGWLLNRVWTFDSQSPEKRAELGRYLSVNLAGAPVTMVLMAILVSGLGLHYLIAGAVVAVGMMFLNYVIHKHWSFRVTKGGDQHRS